MIIDTEEISLLQDKIISYESQLIGNKNVLEFNKYQITLLLMKSVKKMSIEEPISNTKTSMLKRIFKNCK